MRGVLCIMVQNKHSVCKLTSFNSNLSSQRQRCRSLQFRKLDYCNRYAHSPNITMHPMISWGKNYQMFHGINRGRFQTKKLL